MTQKDKRRKANAQHELCKKPNKLGNIFRLCWYCLAYQQRFYNVQCSAAVGVLHQHFYGGWCLANRSVLKILPNKKEHFVSAASTNSSCIANKQFNQTQHTLRDTH